MEMRLHTDQFIVAHGTLTIIGRQPDGDSIRFIPDKLETLQNLPHASRLRPSKDGSVQLRIDGIDAPETHFEGQAQPQGIAAREVFLKSAGFTTVTFDSSGTVVASHPVTIKATILVSLLDPYGRPVSYLLPGAQSTLPEGHLFVPDEKVLAATANIQMLKTGAAYITLYNSTPPSHRDYLRAITTAAKKASLGVWAEDVTNSFTLKNQLSLGPNGKQLILPKLFRRCTSYLQAVDSGFTGTFPAWIQGTATQTYHSEDDYVIRADGSMVPLHTLVQEKAEAITTSIDPLTDVFIEQ